MSKGRILIAQFPLLHFTSNSLFYAQWLLYQREERAMGVAVSESSSQKGTLCF